MVTSINRAYLRRADGSSTQGEGEYTRKLHGALCEEQEREGGEDNAGSGAV